MERNITFCKCKIKIQSRKTIGNKMRLRTYITGALLFVLLLSCSDKQLSTGTVKIKGSDTMLQLTELLAKEYMRLNPGISIYVAGGGSLNGVKALTRNEIDICTASRPLEPDEIKIIADKYGSLGVSYKIAKDALSVFVNPLNRVRNISMTDLKKIFTGEITNWKEIGGEDREIIPIIRSTNSGTYLYFKEHVLKGAEFTDKALVRTSNENVVDEIKKNQDCIGFGGMGFGKDVIHASIDTKRATIENAIDGVYPITRYLYFYTINTPEREVKDFIEFVMSPEGQKIVERSGFIPLWSLSY